MALLGSLGSMFFKKASGVNSFLILLKKPLFYVGGLLYFISAILNIYLLKHMEYSVVLPMTSITYLWTMLFSCLFLKEKITVRKIAGVGAVFAGVIFIVLG
jgi:drug/metabolite transporter (DMT)-like permease